uniref:Homing endonuclease LAGLIDADG domain-containing protein n=1 Tax=Stropharia rugosoannulata TaxID=68746 RepID=A0A3G9H0I9_9AGAR|nr:hypothetical protein [Stropharia rugosoannulata]
MFLKDMENKTLNKNWIEWFVGFCDADANFQVFPKQRSYLKKDGTLSKYINIGYGFHISLSQRETELLKDFQIKFNHIGHIYTYPEKEECRWAVTKKSELIYLIETAFSLDNVILITKHQRERLARLKYVLINNIKRFETSEEFENFLEKSYVQPEINDEYLSQVYLKQDTAFKNWIIGFINGEGYFYVNPRGYLIFSIEHTDRKALELIKQYLDLGPNILDRGNRGDTRQNSYSLSIQSKKDILTIKNLCENPLLNRLEGFKLKQYNNWAHPAKVVDET